MHLNFGIVLSILLPSIWLVRGQMRWGCEYVQSVEPGTSFYFKSPNWPDNYPANSSCRFRATTAWANNKLELKCKIDIPKDRKGCINHRIVVITYVGEVENAKTTRVYCGKKEFTESINEPHNYARMYVEFTSHGTKTGRFTCTIANKGSP